MKKIVLVLGLLAFSAFSFDLEPPTQPTNQVSISVSKDNLFCTYRIHLLVNDNCVAVGSGTSIDKRHILTASHVVSSHDTNETVGRDKGQRFKANNISCTIDCYDAEGSLNKTIKAKIIKNDPELDLAVLETDSDFPNYKSLDYGEVSIGDSLYVVGSAWSMSPYTVSWGNFIAVHSEDFKDLSQLSNTIAPGMSGGGVYNAEGKFLGVITRGAPSLGGLFVPNKVVKKFIKDIKNTKNE